MATSCRLLLREELTNTFNRPEFKSLAAPIKEEHRCLPGPLEADIRISHDLVSKHSSTGVFAFQTARDWLDIRLLFDKLKIGFPSQTGCAKRARNMTR
jgi:hypothetical protein